MEELLKQILAELRTQNRLSQPMDRVQAAEYLGVSPGHLWRLARNNEISYSRLGDGERAPMRFRRQDLDEYLDRCRIRAVE
jgi:excisionase family DNA binding protein